jgi:regulator of cell morphogenesis and NO signaling
MLHQLKHWEIAPLVAEHYAFALLFHLFGVDVFDHTEKTLHELCTEKELDSDSMVSMYEKMSYSHKKRLINLDSVPLEIVIDFITRQHQIIRQRKLPFLHTLVEKLKARNGHMMEIKSSFPKFRQGLEAHMQYEEEVMMPHIVYLMKQAFQSKDLFEVFSILENTSIRQFIKEHEQDERDELFLTMDAAQKLQASAPHDVQVKILLNELQAFNRLLKTHARIENEVLLPKAQQLEDKITEQVLQVAVLN